jgi:hypothetical protein
LSRLFKPEDLARGQFIDAREFEAIEKQLPG